ncbi:hypothetical protein [Hyphomicrobium facile]|uniref:hypothetical protein n=1 Tax=Hyphomicrobium facile TaxID=51670 RepID=UPI0015A64D83
MNQCGDEGRSEIPLELSSWNDGGAKQQIINFVGRVTKSGGADFVPQAQRIAVFDNDGTLTCELPIHVQARFLRDRIKALAPEHPGWKEKGWAVLQPVDELVFGDLHPNPCASGCIVER